MGNDGHPVIAIVGYRNAGDIRACLAALALSNEKRFAISVCENGGADAYRALIAALGDLTEPTSEPTNVLDQRVTQIWTGRLRPHQQDVRIYCANANLGYAGGVNVCIRQIPSGENWSAIWVLNPDTEPDPDALGVLLDRSAQGYDIVGSRLVDKSDGRIQSCGCRWRPFIARGLNLGVDQPVLDLDEIERRMNYVSGASLFATRSFVADVGLMEDRYFLYCEEVDWCLRRGRHRIGYAHNSVVYHAGSSTIGDTTDARKPLPVYLDERNRLLVTRRFYPLLYPFVILTTLGVLTVKYLRIASFNNFLIAVSGWWAGVRGEFGPPRRWTKA